MLINFVRAMVLYIVVLLVTRLMGKREVGELQPFEFVISLMIANLATIPMAEAGIPITSGITPILGLLVMHLIITVLNLKCIRFRYITCGKPAILIYRGKIDEKVLEKERYTVSELQVKLREKSVFNIADVEYAILETSGDISVILKPEKQNTTLEDLGIEKEYTGITYDLVLDGRVMDENIQKLGKDNKWLERQLKKFHTIPKDTLVATIDAKGNFFCQAKDKKSK